MFAYDKSVITLVSGAGGGGPQITWKRFKRDVLNDYYYLEQSTWDSVIFIPQTNIVFHGFGAYSSWNNCAVSYNIKWALDDEEPCEQTEITKEDAEKDEQKCFTFTLKELGSKPVKVKAEQKLHVCMKIVRQEYEQRRCFYGSDGNESQYNEIEQPNDFKMETSRLNGNCTSHNWG